MRYANVAGATSTCGERRKNETHLIPNLIKAAIKREKAILYGKNLPTPDGSCERDYVHIKDIVQAHLQIREQRGIFNLASGRTYSNLSVVRMVEEVTGKNLDLHFKEMREGDALQVRLEMSKAKRELAFSASNSNLRAIVSSVYEFLLTLRR